ncbi:MAG: hypothetical protein MJ185_03405 [Treponema sp.]|nr:hypothetical protein [Treponema sp.]
MKKFLPLVMCLLATGFISACSQSNSKVDGLSFIEIVLPDGPALGREIETENQQTIYNFLLTVSNEADENDSVFNTGKSGEKLKVEVNPGIYFIKLQAFALEDTELSDVLYEASKEHVEVFAGKVTKVSLELSKIISEAEEGNVEVSVFDPANISITGKHVLEVDDFDYEYSTLKFPGASYIWYWDGEEVENKTHETGETCAINTSKLESVETGLHTLKVEIECNGVWGEASMEVGIMPEYHVYYNKSKGGSYPTDTDTKKESTEWKLRADSDFEKYGYVSGVSPLTASCFDNNYSFYTAEFNNEGCQLDQYKFNIFNGYSASKKEAFATISTDEYFIPRMASDGDCIYFITSSRTFGEDGNEKDKFGFYFDSEKDKNNLWLIRKNESEPSNINVSDYMTVCTSVSYENGHLYVAGYEIESDHIYKENYGYDENEKTVNVYDYLYKIVKFPVENNIVNTEKGKCENIYEYYDHDVNGSNLLSEILGKSGGSGTVSVNNQITDLIVKNECIYALRCENIRSDDPYCQRFSFSVLYKDRSATAIIEESIRHLSNNETVKTDSGDYSESILPVRIYAVRRKELDFVDSNSESKALIRTVNLSDMDSILVNRNGEYGYYFDVNTYGSSLNVENHLYQAGNFESEFAPIDNSVF